MLTTRYSLAADFLAAAGDFLVHREVQNCLPLGLAAQLVERPDIVRTPPYLAAVSRTGAVIAAAIMTLPGRLILAEFDTQEGLGAIAADLREAGICLTHVIGSTMASTAFVEHWRSLTGQAAQPGMSERLYQLASANHPPGVAGYARPATLADRDRLIRWYDEFEQEAFGTAPGDAAGRVDSVFALASRGVYLWEDGEPVSMAGYGGRTPHGIRIGPVYTPPAFRGRGYASACVARLSQDQLDAGRRFCCLYTDRANPTSNHIYQAIGYEPVCDVQEYRLLPPA